MRRVYIPFQSPLTPIPPFGSYLQCTLEFMSQQTPAFAYPVYAPSPDTQQTTVTSSSSSAPQPQSRQAAEDARKDRTLAEFMLMLDDYEPLVRSQSTLLPPFAKRYSVRSPMKLPTIIYSVLDSSAKTFDCAANATLSRLTHFDVAFTV